MNIGDRVRVIAADEYRGFHGQIVDINAKGDLVVDVEVPFKHRAVFKPGDLAPARRKLREARPTDGHAEGAPARPKDRR